MPQQNDHTAERSTQGTANPTRSYDRDSSGANRFNSRREYPNPAGPSTTQHAGEPAKSCRFRFEKLEVWRDACALNQEIHRLVQNLAGSDNNSLPALIQHSALSVSAGIAEGATRGSDDDFARALERVHGTLMQLGSHLYVAQDVGYFKPAQTESAMDQIERLGARLIAFRRSFFAKAKNEPAQTRS
jgi:four helix bundle protein